MMGWTPCRYPERPLDATADIHAVNCVGCFVALEAALRNTPPGLHLDRLVEIYDAAVFVRSLA